MKADLILAGGPVRAPATRWEPVEAVAVAGGRILAAGRRADLDHLAGPGTRRIDLGGGCLLPGLADSHLHVLSYGLSLRRLRLDGVRSLAAMVWAVGERAAALPPGAWVRGRGWDQERWHEGRWPHRRDLDAVAPDRPVFLQRACGHIGVANSAALRLAGVSAGTPDPADGAFDRDPDGEPTGVMRESAQEWVARVVPPVTPAEQAAALDAAVRDLLSLGITQVDTDDVTAAGGAAQALALYGAALGPGAARLRATLLLRVAHLDDALAQGFRTGARLPAAGADDGLPWLRWGPVKLFADGSLGGRTAALRAPYSDDPATHGIYMYPREEFIDLFGRIHALGLQTGVHAIGDGAAELVLDAVAAAQAAHPRLDHRHRLIHCQITGGDQLRRCRDLRAVADIQPVFLRTDGHWFGARVGPERAATSYAWGTLRRLGVSACGGSDAPIEPPNPLYGIYCAVTRRDLEGHPPGGWNPAEALRVTGALELFTAGAAYANFEEGWRGDLRPGMAADFTVLDRDPLAVAPAELKDLQAVLTVVGGEVAYRR